MVVLKELGSRYMPSRPAAESSHPQLLTDSLFPGAYFGSSSWFDACILRPLSPSDPRPPITPETAARIEKLIQRSGPPSSSETFPTFLVGNLLSNDPEDARSLFRSLGWDFVERVERVEVDGEVGERRSLVWKLQSNLVACKEYLVHGGEWRRTGEQGEGEQEGDRGSGDGLGFMDLMKAGDRVGIWARAMVSFLFVGVVPEDQFTDLRFDTSFPGG